MTRYNRNTIVFFSFVLVLIGFSCRQRSPADTDVTAQQPKEYSDFNRRYNAISSWDTIAFTYKLQEMLLENKQPIAFQGKVVDILKSDSTFVLVVRHRWRLYRNYVAYIKVDPGNFARLNNIEFRAEGSFIFRVYQIRVVPTEIVPKAEIPEEDSEPDAYLTFELQNPLVVFEGDYIDADFNYN